MVLTDALLEGKQGLEVRVIRCEKTKINVFNQKISMAKLATATVFAYKNYKGGGDAGGRFPPLLENSFKGGK